MEHGFTQPQMPNECAPITNCPPVKSVTKITNKQSNNLIVPLSHPDAIIPKQESTKAARYDLYSVQITIIKPKYIARINTDIKIQLHMYTYVRVASRSGLLVKREISIKGGVVDPDCTGEI